MDKERVGRRFWLGHDVELILDFKQIEFYFSNRNLDVAIKPIPTMPTIVAIPVVFSPKILPSHIKKAPVNAAKIPNINNAGFVFSIFFHFLKRKGQLNCF